jgi:hypothetical protein
MQILEKKAMSTPYFVPHLEIGKKDYIVDRAEFEFESSKFFFPLESPRTLAHGAVQCAESKNRGARSMQPVVRRLYGFVFKIWVKE